MSNVHTSLFHLIRDLKVALFFVMAKHIPLVTIQLFLFSCYPNTASVTITPCVCMYCKNVGLSERKIPIRTAGLTNICMYNVN